MTSDSPAEPLPLEVRAGRREVPAVIWLPVAHPATDLLPDSAPLVLLGHGGSGHKTSPRQRDLAARLVARGCAVVAIDGPLHGERASTRPGDYQQQLVDRGVQRVMAQMTQDWLAATEAAGRIGGVDVQRVGYLGMSMGARFGLPTAATLGDRLRCAVLGKLGLEQSDLLHPGLLAAAALSAGARSLTAATLWHVQWDDEVFPRPGQLALFDELASPAKRLVAFPGRHAETQPAAVEAWVDFLAEHLSGSMQRSHIDPRGRRTASRTPPQRRNGRRVPGDP